MEYIRPFTSINLTDQALVGGKNASLGEMLAHLQQVGIQVPGGFAVTVTAYRHFLAQNGLDVKIFPLINDLNVENINDLKSISALIRNDILQATFSNELLKDIKSAYLSLGKGQPISVAVRSSATAEDLPGYSFAGQQDSYLNIVGEESVSSAIKQVYASLFTERAIAYRCHHQFDHSKVGISVGVQKMVRSDLGASGVAFTVDTESGFDQVVFITACYGLGESLVQGMINPDEYYVHKHLLDQNRHAIIKKNLGTKHTKKIYQTIDGHPERLATTNVKAEEQMAFCLTDGLIHELARQAMKIENHYQQHMDIEWAQDGLDGKLYIVQARPETVKNTKNQGVIERYHLASEGKIVVTGRSIGDRIGQGRARVILEHKNMHEVEPGEILVTDMTDPDWEPVMKRASAIVTNRGGRTCHAAIIARELGIPAVVGCNTATLDVISGQSFTVSCAGGETGFVYKGLVPYEIEKIEIHKMPDLAVDICMNLGDPEKAFSYQAIPNKGVGLARLEFIINNMIGIHPRALLELADLPKELHQIIRHKISAYSSATEYYIERLREGIATMAAAFYPKPVVVRFSDFKTNEYSNLIGGALFEPKEDNPMIGYRGASRYLSKEFRDCFELECIAIRRVREEMGLTNIKVMIPFVRTIQEAKNVIQLLADFGLSRGQNGLEVYMMCEIPSNAILAQEFLEYFDGYSIGSNDLTQLTLGLDRDSSLVEKLFDERDLAVKTLLRNVIQTCRKANKYIGICGQGPSDHPDFAKWLVKEGISAISLSPDTVTRTWLYLANSCSAQN